ncbi:MAG TPA: hypothetical protein PKE00_05530 [Planctomycetota bacterium]|nr:hypothetical protein [Planctomycetota bacterium]
MYGVTCLALLMAMPSCSKSKTKPAPATTEGQQSKTSAAPDVNRASEPAPRKSRSQTGKARGTQAAPRPLPRLDAAATTKVDKLIDDAKAAYNKALTANAASPPDKETFFASLNSCKDLLDAADEVLVPVTAWEEESTMGDWRVSADEDGYLRTVQPLLNRIDKLRSAAEKISRAR